MPGAFWAVALWRQRARISLRHGFEWTRKSSSVEAGRVQPGLGTQNFPRVGAGLAELRPPKWIRIPKDSSVSACVLANGSGNWAPPWSSIYRFIELVTCLPFSSVLNALEAAKSTLWAQGISLLHVQYLFFSNTQVAEELSCFFALSPK